MLLGKVLQEVGGTQSELTLLKQFNVVDIVMDALVNGKGDPQLEE